ncbi:hypothetical protein IWQ61_008361 [Dispira simplex]|nr:hypothetical protein IWQ61_008361 [Dispira simplex]
MTSLTIGALLATIAIITTLTAMSIRTTGAPFTRGTTRAITFFGFTIVLVHTIITGWVRFNTGQRSSRKVQGSNSNKQKATHMPSEEHVNDA